MNFLNEIGKQLRDLFASMTPASRIMAGLMIAVVLVSLGWIMSGGASSPKTEYLFGGRNSTDVELASMEAAFGNAQLGDYERVGQRIKIPSAKKAEYLKALNTASALPGDHKSAFKTQLERNNPFESSDKWKLGVDIARQQQLENTIKNYNGIQLAIVNYDEQRTGFGKKNDQVCFIAVQGFNGTPIPQNMLKNIQKIAAHTFAGLKEENVTVTDLGTGTLVAGGSNGNDENAYFVAQSMYETKYEAKISSLFPEFDARISVNVALDPTLRTQSELLQYQQQSVPLSTSTSTKTAENAKGSPGGQPGAAPNGVSNQSATLSTGSVAQNSKIKETQENQKSAAGHEATIKNTVGLVPKSVHVTIGIPESHYRNILLQRFRLDNPGKAESDAPTPTAKDLDDIRLAEEKRVRLAVENLVTDGRQGTDKATLTNVYSFVDIPQTVAAGPTFTDNALGWLSESWTTVALMGLVLVSLGMMFSWLKSPVTSGDTDKRFAEGFGLEIPSIPLDQLDLGADGDEAVGEDGRRKPPALEVTGTEMKEDLSTIIKENPDAAVNLIKAWIGEAA